MSHKSYRLNVMSWSDGLAVCALTDEAYPLRIAFTCLSKVHDDFKRKIPEALYKQMRERDADAGFRDDLRKILKAHADPKKFDAVTSTQAKVDAVTDIMQKNLEQVLGNMPQVEMLLDESEDLHANTKAMFQTSKKLKKNACCSLM